MEAPKSIALLGQSHAVTMPDFATREELFLAYGETYERGGVPLLRAFAAAIGLCTRIGRLAQIDYAATKYDVLGYGGQVYSWLREKGVSQAEIRDLGLPLILQIHAGLFPRKDERDAALGN